MRNNKISNHFFLYNNIKNDIKIARQQSTRKGIRRGLWTNYFNAAFVYKASPAVADNLYHSN